MPETETAGPTAPSKVDKAECDAAMRSYNLEAQSLRRDKAAIRAKQLQAHVKCGLPPPEEPEPRRRSASTGAPAAPQQLLDPYTSQVMPRAAGGYMDPRTGTFYQDAAGGVVNTRTGEFIPTH